MNTPAFTADANRLVKLLETAIVFAGDDTTLPMLRCVRLERHGDHLIGATTDRFRIGVVKIDVNWDDNAPADWATMITRDDVAQIATSYKAKGGRGLDKITTETNGDQLVLTRTSSAITLTIDAADFNFPKWRSLIPRSDDKDMGGPASVLNLDLLKGFEKAKWSTNDQLHIEYPVERKPAIITCGHHFLGLLMPLQSNDRAAWDEVLDHPVESGNRHGEPEIAAAA